MVLTDAPATVHAEVDRRLSAGGQRYSRARRRIVQALASADRPLSVADLVAAVPGLALSSAYRNLGVLTDVGAVTRVATDDDVARHELAEALTQHHHHHLVCTGCGLVLDWDPPAALEQQVAAGLDAAARVTGFTPEGHRLDILGRCTDCTRTG